MKFVRNQDVGFCRQKKRPNNYRHETQANKKKLQYSGSLLTVEEICVTEIRRRIGIVKGAFKNLSKILRNSYISL